MTQIVDAKKLKKNKKNSLFQIKNRFIYISSTHFIKENFPKQA